jgi:hypothetical protein
LGNKIRSFDSIFFYLGAFIEEGTDLYTSILGPMKERLTRLSAPNELGI